MVRSNMIFSRLSVLKQDNGDTRIRKLKVCKKIYKNVAKAMSRDGMYEHEVKNNGH